MLINAGKHHESTLHLFIDVFVSSLFSGSVGAGSAAVAVAAAQAVTTTLQMQPVRRGSGALKPPYAAALGGCTDFLGLLFPDQASLPFLRNFTLCHEETSLQSRRDFGQRAPSIFVAKIMAVVVDVSGSGRLGRERNWYQGGE